MTKYFYEGKEIFTHQVLQLEKKVGDTVQTVSLAKNWDKNYALDYLRGFGVTTQEVADPVSVPSEPDAHFKYNADGSAMTIDQVREIAKKANDQLCYGFLSVTDWYITRRAENGTSVPTEVTEERKQIREDHESLNAAIGSCTTIDQLVSLYSLKPHGGFGFQSYRYKPNDDKDNT